MKSYQALAGPNSLKVTYQAAKVSKIRGCPKTDIALKNKMSVLSFN
jgi:hypothetical protein